MHYFWFPKFWWDHKRYIFIEALKCIGVKVNARKFSSSSSNFCLVQILHKNGGRAVFFDWDVPIFQEVWQVSNLDHVYQGRPSNQSQAWGRAGRCDALLRFNFTSPTLTSTSPSLPGCQVAGHRLWPRGSVKRRAKANAGGAQHRNFPTLPFPGVFGDTGSLSDPPSSRRPLQLHHSPIVQGQRKIVTLKKLAGC